MKITAGLIVLAACMPYMVVGDAAAAAAAAASSGNGASSAAAAAAASGNGAAAAAAAAASSDVIHHGIDCYCHDAYKPVCGSDGNTYSNECALECVSDYRVNKGMSGVRVWRHGQCPAIKCFCSQDVKPVCGTNNQTYTNECYLVCEKAYRKENKIPSLELAYRTKCQATPCYCPKCVIPVCGTDGKTYRNACVMNCYSRANKAKCLPEIRVADPGACKEETCRCRTPKDELCATDGSTYYNDCALECQNRRRGQLDQSPLSVRYRGKCIPCPCQPVYKPVCANNDVTFSNECSFNCENEWRFLHKLKLLLMRWSGRCDCGCPTDYKPVCAGNKVTKDRTYLNACTVRCLNRKLIQDGRLPLSWVPGKCAKCTCPECNNTSYKPVCGTDRRTYWNMCWLKCNIQCREDNHEPILRKAHNGRCR